MKTIYKQSILIFLIVMIFIITNLISINIKKKRKSKIIPLSNNHVDASFVSPQYIKNIKNTPNEIKKYKNLVKQHYK